MRIYLDHNAGAPLRPAVREAIAEFISGRAEGNPASVHLAGQQARRLLEHSRAEVGALIGAPARTIVFTSGGTESNNLAIYGAIDGFAGRRRKIITAAIEHSSIIGPVAELERRGFEIERVAVDREGRISSTEMAALIDDQTAVITLGLANAEVGTIQSLDGVAEAARRAGAVFHLDAAQAAGRMPLGVADVQCDLMALSAHKIGGPAGIGALYVRPACMIAPQIQGGPQETGMRAGTPNLLGAVGFAAAARETLAGMPEELDRMAAHSRWLLNALEGAIPGLILNGPREGRIENTLNLTFPRVLGESLLIALDLEGLEISMGSACAAGSVEPSHVLLAMGRSPAEARSSLRISLGWSTTAAEIARAAEIVPRIWRRVAAAEPAIEGASR
ncbi:MAG TPA: cysteine desulfurase family protein [Candidatus Binataceae bacterium]|nr:cysteine desulfurase family protein [Candidatus Binataceae bacterium]